MWVSSHFSLQGEACRRECPSLGDPSFDWLIDKWNDQSIDQLITWPKYIPVNFSQAEDLRPLRLERPIELCRSTGLLLDDVCTQEVGIMQYTFRPIGNGSRKTAVHGWISIFSGSCNGNKFLVVHWYLVESASWHWIQRYDDWSATLWSNVARPLSSETSEGAQPLWEVSSRVANNFVVDRSRSRRWGRWRSGTCKCESLAFFLNSAVESWKLFFNHHGRHILMKYQKIQRSPIHHLSNRVNPTTRQRLRVRLRPTVPRLGIGLFGHLDDYFDL